jgi:hypothetical protein
MHDVPNDLESSVQPGSIRVPNEMKAIFIAVFVSLLFMKNGFYLFICFLGLLLITSILWKPYRPAILYFCFTMQWIQIVTYVFWLNSADIPVNGKYPMMPYAIIESIIGLILMVFTVNLVTRRHSAISLDEITRAADKWDKRKVVILYASSTIFLSSIGLIFPDMKSGLTQILITIQDVKWVFLIIYGLILWSKRESKSLFWPICLYEFLISFYSYFSDFKTVTFIVLILLLAFVVELNYKRAMSIILLTLVMGFAFLTWTAIKGEYRNFLSSGKRLQKVYVSKKDAFQNIALQIGTLNYEKYEQSYTNALYRVQYILHLHRVMQRIPAFMQHENGGLWRSNLEYILTPRALFPDKSILDPSVKTNKYTGYRYATGKSGVSFSLGYYAESYVDFGHVWMFIPLVLIALYVGIIYNAIMRMREVNLLARIGMVTVIILVFFTIEADGIFLVGRLTTGFLVMLFLGKTLFPLIQRWAFAARRGGTDSENTS